LEAGGCQLLREGASHSIYTNPANGVREAVPRHSEIKRHLARGICRRLGVDVPSGA
jgi:mRNA interferase HicA